MSPGDILDVTLRSMRVAEVRHMSTVLVGTLPNGEPFEVRLPFDAEFTAAPVERPEVPDTCQAWDGPAPDDAESSWGDLDHSHDCRRGATHNGSHCCRCGTWWRSR